MRNSVGHIADRNGQHSRTRSGGPSTHGTIEGGYDGTISSPWPGKPFLSIVPVPVATLVGESM